LILCNTVLCPDNKYSKEKLKIGLVFPLSGNLGYVGQMEADGIRLAVDDYNAKSARKIELVIEDSQGKPDIGVTAAKKLINVDKVDVMMSSLSSVTLALLPTVKESNTILIGCCMAPDFYKDSEYVFRFYEGVEQESEGLLQYYKTIASRKGVVTGVLYADVPNVRSQLEEYIRPKLKEAGMDYKVAEPYKLTDKEFRDKVLKLKNNGVNNLLILGYGFEYPNIFKSIKEEGLINNIEIVGGWGFLYNKLPKQDLKGITVVGPSYVFSKSKDISEFYSRFKKRYGYEANFDAAITYSAMQLIIVAYAEIEKISQNGLVHNLSVLNKVSTLLGITTVDKYGAINFEIGMGKY
jgi:branched-chain amino acid transport system substrate-binding protein